MVKTGELCRLAINNIDARTNFYKAGGFLDNDNANAIAYMSNSVSERFANAVKDSSVGSLQFLRSCLESYYNERAESEFIVNKYYSDCEGEAIKETLVMINYVLDDNKEKIR